MIKLRFNQLGKTVIYSNKNTSFLDLFRHKLIFKIPVIRLLSLSRIPKLKNEIDMEWVMQNRWSKGPRAASIMSLTASYRMVKFLICIFIMRSIRLSINRKEKILVGGLLFVSVLCSISAWQVYSNGRRRIGREIRSTDSEQKISPDFLIIGAQFCGTEYLQKLLSHHPLLKQCKNGILLHDQVREGVIYFI